MIDFINSYEYSNSYPLIEQIMSAVHQKDASKLYTFYLDFNSLPTEIRKTLFEYSDFTKFSKEFTKTARQIISQASYEFYEKIRNLDMKVRFNNFMYDPNKNEYKDLCKISGINSSHTERFVTFKGVISTVLSPKGSMRKVRFECSNCGEAINIDFNDSSNIVITEQIKECTGCGEKDSFKMVRVNSSHTDTQTVFIEELSNDSENDAAVIEVLLDGDKVGKFNIGDTVVVTGNVRLDVYNDASVNQFKKKLHDSKYFNMLSSYGGALNGVDFDYIVECNNIEKINDTNILFTNLSEDEKKQIIALSTDHRIMEKLIGSFAPHIWGHEIEKEALIYQLVGGLGRSKDPEVDKRGEINILLFGDPSTAKSDLLLFSLSISPKVRFADGGGMSRVGLTGGVVNSGDDTGSSGNWKLTAGMAQICDDGMLCIDELNDCQKDVIGALKEIMEKQTATVVKVKSGSFKARISVLAACNPPDSGNYDKTKNFNENLGINAALITRFDAIFLFRDIPNPETDLNIANMMLKSYTKEIVPPISKEMLAKYIYYMKTNGNIPVLSKEVINYIPQLYTRIRTMDLNYNAEHIEDQERRSVSTRQLSSIVRLCTARAMLLNKKEVDISDVQAAEKIVTYMINTVAMDVNTGKVDIGILSGKSSNDMSRDEQFFDLLERMADSFDNKVDKDHFIPELLKQSKWKDDPIPKIEKAIMKYENQQYISTMNNHISLSNYVVKSTNRGKNQ